MRRDLSNWREAPNRFGVVPHHCLAPWRCAVALGCAAVAAPLTGCSNAGAAPTGPAAAPEVSATEKNDTALAEVVRSGFVESRHRVSLRMIGADGAPQLTTGQGDAPMFPRSRNALR